MGKILKTDGQTDSVTTGKQNIGSNTKRLWIWCYRLSVI